MSSLNADREVSGGSEPHRGQGISLSLALPNGVDPVSRWRTTARAHENFLRSDPHGHAEVRPVVLESWRRSAALRVDPDRRDSPMALVDDALEEARATHPLRHAMPVVRRLLVDDAADAGVLVIVGDARGRILWAEGDDDLRRRAERLHLQAGADWCEDAMGTNAIGTALAIGDTVQVFGSEHYARSVQPWSCTAAPIRDPRTGHVLGVLDITGGASVVAPQSAFLVRSAVAAVEAELRLVGGAVAATPGSRLEILGRPRGRLVHLGRSVELSLRHTELLLLLAEHPDGLSASELAWQLYEHDAAEVTVRAEMSRLRKAVPELVSPAGQYRLRTELRTDAMDVADRLTRGDHRGAVELYRGDLLPRSAAPGVVTLRYRLHGWLRNVLLQSGDGEALRRYAMSPSGREDAQIWRACLDGLAPGSPQRAEAAAVLAGLDGELGHTG
ncbi:GAF domain-containing protein [Jiangella aurantiaca]|uniref:GAF domain-containing protein n=1 Tax=Jiangella aurantiaca TaxID=2530373 RepID=UPI0013A5D749|nr:GAF domain-containing protein [Jiangella aurantiaca]